MKTIDVIFKTLTPVYFGNAQQEFNEIRPSEILGCMRFWLDIVNLAILEKNMDDLDKLISTKSTNNKDYKTKIDENILNKLLKNPKSSSLDEMILEEYKRIFKTERWSDLLFGCENFKGNVFIEDFTNIEKDISRVINTKIEIKNDGETKCWFLPFKLYMGEFTVKFKVNEFFLKDYFYPLLHFINEVGYLGGKWNLGFGRVEVVEVIDESENQKVDLKNFSKFNKCIKIVYSKNYNINTHFENIRKGINDNRNKVVKFITDREFKLLEEVNIEKKDHKEIKVIVSEYVKNTYKSYIKDVLEEKINYRNIIRGKKEDEKEQKKS